ncbi:MAG: cobalt ECF transporter T component CbiQ [Deltaproteobacteria bacterium]|nr:cobalt ECF transporter T component CbiQ [Deltaproteobacteria bacterium]
MIQEPFVNDTSPMQRLDPRSRILMATAFAFVVALSDLLSALLPALVVSAVLMVISGLPVRDVLKRLMVVNGFVLFLWLVVPVTFPGTPLFHLGPLTATWEGVLVSARITIKCNAILLVFIALVAVSPVATLGAALARMRVPEKIVLLLLMSYRYIFVMETEYQRLARSASVRGFRPSTSIHTYRTFAYLIGMLFVRASARAERVYAAMLCRGFSGKFHSLRDFSFSKKDGIWAVCMTGALLAIGAAEWMH